jgi:hypothetical protein
MSSDDKTKLNGIASGAEANVQSDWNATDTSSDAYIKNKPTIPTTLSQLTGDSTHRVVTDAEKTAWNNKADTANTIPSSEKGAANGVAVLGNDGHLTPAMMPTTMKTTAPATIESDTWTLLSDLTMIIPGGTVALCCVQTTWSDGQPTGVAMSLTNAADGATSATRVLYKLEREDIAAINTCIMQNNRSNNPRPIYVWVKYGKSGTTGTINDPGRCSSSMTILGNYI